MNPSLRLVFLVLALTAAPALAQARSAQSPQPAQPAPGPGTTQPAPRAEPSLGALLEYRDRRLQLRTQTSYYGGNTYVVHRYYRYGWNPYLGIGTTSVYTTPITAEHTWMIFQGDNRLSVPAYLRLIGADEEYRSIMSAIRRNQIGAGIFLGVFGWSVGAVAVGSFGMHFATSAQGYYGFGAMLFGGVIGVIVGVVGALASASYARRLRWEFPDSLEPLREEGRIARYNEGLQRSLGLTADEAARVDTYLGTRR